MNQFGKYPIMSDLIDKLKNMFTAMAYAEVGDFDTVKQLLRVEPDKRKAEECEAKRCPPQPVVPAI